MCLLLFFFLGRFFGCLSRCFGSLGLSFSPAKCKVLIVALDSRHHRLLSPLRLANNAVLPQVDSARYLGVLLDNRLNFNEHWAAESGRLRALIGSSHRLLKDQPQLFRILVSSVAEGRLRHALPATPPASAAAWRTVRGAFVLAARLQLNEWHKPPGQFSYSVGSAEVLERAGFLEPQSLALELGLTLLYKAVFKDRQLGLHLPHLRFSPRTRQGRSGAVFLAPPDVTKQRLRHLSPFRLCQLWNALAYPPASNGILPSSLPPIPTSSLSTFLNALPTYLPFL